jgi:DNA-binding MarR family transcriptional regulator
VRTKRIGQLLFVAAQAAQSLATSRLDRLGLTPRGWGVLSTLVESGPLTQIQLATGLAIDRTAMVYLIDDLEQARLVQRIRSADDRRAFAIHLTGDGRALQRKAATQMSKAAQTLLEPLDAEAQAALRTLLGRVVEHWQTVSG